MTSAGIYIHIPFCRSRCSYCDFATGIYDSTQAVRYTQALKEEILTWTEIEVPEKIDTIYFGGGTPSLLSTQQVSTILDTIYSRIALKPGVHLEVTMEINPGTVTPESLNELRQAGINRASFGAQTFDDRELARLGRSHNAQQTRDTFLHLREAGFNNISLDLIAGLPGQSLERWERNVDEALAMKPEHLSFYLLEVHQGTPLADHIKRGLQPKPDEEIAAQMYASILERAVAAGYEHYEISNLCLPGFESRHNTKYWTGAPYYGFGCSAQSYDGRSRRWSNERDVAHYIELIETKCSPIVDRTELSEDEIRAESLFLGLRLMRGVDLNAYQTRFGCDVHISHENDLERFREAGLIEYEGNLMRLTRTGALLSNEVFSAFV
ncbi:MAG TPA: radical SAM family heme chaperone HemW [Pyrinomonadaceae bacterium]|nr:radical SAM family heme chaperone HemW [Pyrinomonadaceae bacterium]